MSHVTCTLRTKTLGQTPGSVSLALTGKKSFLVHREIIANSSMLSHGFHIILVTVLVSKGLGSFFSETNFGH